MNSSKKITYQNNYRFDFINESYEIIENENLNDCKQIDLTISGALLKNNIFRKVHFQNCTFFGSKISDCQFIGCRFENCKFDFTNIDNCNFLSTQFNDTIWPTANINKSYFKNCLLDFKTGHRIGNGENEIQFCFRHGDPPVPISPNSFFINRKFLASFHQSKDKRNLT